MKPCCVQVTGLLHELLLLVGMFALLEPRNQDVLLWGSLPTPVHKLCALADCTQHSVALINSVTCTLLAVCVSNPRTCEVRAASHASCCSSQLEVLLDFEAHVVLEGMLQRGCSL